MAKSKLTLGSQRDAVEATLSKAQRKKKAIDEAPKKAKKKESPKKEDPKK